MTSSVKPVQGSRLTSTAGLEPGDALLTTAPIASAEYGTLPAGSVMIFHHAEHGLPGVYQGEGPVDFWSPHAFTFIGRPSPDGRIENEGVCDLGELLRELPVKVWFRGGGTCEAGPARGHDWSLDKSTLEIVAFTILPEAPEQPTDRAKVVKHG